MSHNNIVSAGDFPQPKRRLRKPQATGVYLFTPANLVIPDDHKDVENEIRYYIHVILTSIYNRKHEIEGWARINRKLMQSIVGDPTKESKARAWLLANHVIGTEFSYSSTNHVSNSYYLHPEYEPEIHRWETTKKRLAYKLQLMRSLRFDDKSLRTLDEAKTWADLTTDEQSVYRRLANWCGRLHIDLDACRQTLKSLQRNEADITMATAELIGTDNADFKADSYLRFHSPLTRLFTPLRAHLSFNGQKLVNVDIRNSQVVFFLKVMKEHLLIRCVEQDDRRNEGEARRVIPFSADGVAVDSCSARVLQSRSVADAHSDESSTSLQFCSTLYNEVRSFQPLSFPPTTIPRPTSLCYRNKTPPNPLPNITYSPTSLCYRNKKPLVDNDVDEFTRLVEKGEIYDYLLDRVKDQLDGAIEMALLHRVNRKAKEAKWKKRYRAFCCENPVTTAEEARRRKDAYARSHRVKDVALEWIDVLTRDHLKRLFFADVFYGRVKVDTPLTRLFARLFPTVYHVILDCKRERYQDLARKMQREEAKFILHTVCRRLFKYHEAVPVFTIHDSIMTTEEHVPLVRGIIIEEFDRIGLHPTLKEE